MVIVMLAEVEFYSPYDVVVRGSYGIADHLRTVKRGRGSVWLPLNRGFSVSERVARDLIALLEQRGGWDIVVTNRGRSTQAETLCHGVTQFPSAPTQTTVPSVSASTVEAGLW